MSVWFQEENGSGGEEVPGPLFSFFNKLKNLGEPIGVDQWQHFEFLRVQMVKGRRHRTC